MNYADRVRAAHSPQEAIAILAEGIDALLAAPAPAADAWGWEQPSTTEISSQPGILVAQPQRDEAAIAAIYAEMEKASDPSDIRALEAKLRLAQDTGAPPDPALADGNRAKVHVDGNLVTIDLAEASAERKDERLDFATKAKFHTMVQPALTEDEAITAYVEGGPLWLYHYDDVAVRGMPGSWKRKMVEDVAIDSPRDAHELAADLLKDLDPGELV